MHRWRNAALMLSMLGMALGLALAAEPTTALFRGDGARTGFYPGGLGAGEKNGPTVFFGSTDQDFYALDAVTMNSYWKHHFETPVISHPIVHAGRVLLGTENGNVRAVNARKQEDIWCQPAGQMYGAPIVVGDRIFLTAYAPKPNAPRGGGYVYALQWENGKEIWKKQIGSLLDSTPAYCDGVVYAGSNNSCFYALDAATGAEKWKVITGDTIIASAAFYNGQVWIGSMDGKMYVLDAAAGTEIKKLNMGAGITTALAIAGDTGYLGLANGNVVALHLKDGVELWRRKDLGYKVTGTPAVANDVVYVGTWENMFYALNTQTGKITWDHQMDDRVVGSAAVWNGIVFVPCCDDYMHALDAKTGQEKWQAITGNNVITSPVVAD